MCVCVLRRVICFIINFLLLNSFFCSLLPSFARLKASFFSNTIESSLENTKRCPCAVLCVLTRRQLAEKYEMAATAYKILPRTTRWQRSAADSSSGSITLTVTATATVTAAVAAAATTEE